MSHNPFYNIENPELIGYEYAWVNYFKNNEIHENIIHGPILASWKRCRDGGLDPTVRTVEEHKCSNAMLRQKLQENSTLLEIAEPIMENLVQVLGEKNMDVCFVDQYGIVLKVVSHNEIVSRITRVGADFSEEAIGTNCIDLSLRHDLPLSVIGAQHYYQQNHKYAGYAAPVHESGKTQKGVIASFVRLEHMSEYLISIVTTAAKAIENGLGLYNSREVINQQNHEKQDILDSVTDGILYVNKNLIITHANMEFTRFTGLRREELIGSNINLLDTAPRIDLLVESSGENHRDIRVKLRGKTKSLNCFLRHKTVRSRFADADSVIWIFTTIDGIKELAAKITVENRAFFTFQDITGKSRRMAECIELAKKVADHGARTIIEGESGTGKEIIAQSIHNRSARQGGPFVAVDCGAIPRELLESEIFGYEEGAYTGARKGGHRGKFELAHNGTLFLDEIGNLPLEMQAKLLRVLQESRVVRIGGYNPVPVDVLVIAATNQNLTKAIEDGTFREDLFYRLNIVHIKLPPLRERREDIPLLISHFIQKSGPGHENKRIDEEAMEILRRYDWPGNVRQLNNTLERMLILSDGDVLTKDLIPEDIRQSMAQPENLILQPGRLETLQYVTARYIYYALQECGGNVKKTAENLDISRATIYRTLKQAGLL